MERETQRQNNPLVLAWLGTPIVSYADHPVTFRTRKALALLVYLTTEAGVYPREKLTTFFWPESDTPRGRSMLRTTLAHLRSGLGADATSYLSIAPQTLSFDFDSHFELDLHRLQASLEAIQRQPSRARDNTIGQLQTVVDRYRGDFLEGFILADAPAFDDWVSLQREIWHSRMNLIFDTLSQWQFETGDLLAAGETAARWKAHDLYGERATQRLMQIHLADGNRAAALSAYAMYSQMLEDEFGDKPSAEINALAARVRAGAPTRQGREVAPAPRVAEDFRFVGRGEEFAQLAQAYHAASRGQTQVVVVSGETGIGKTRLTVEFLHWARAQGADLLTGRAYETGGEVPYQPLAQLLRQRLDQEKSPGDLLSTIWLAELSCLLPELRDCVLELPPPQAHEATAQSRLLESIARLGEALAARSPLLLFIDDVQWCDQASLDALHYAMSRWAEHQAPILLLICARDVALTEKGSVRQWLARLKTGLVVTPLELAPLTVEDTLALVSSLEMEAGTPRQEARGEEGGEMLSSSDAAVTSKFNAFAQALYTETGGQPLYLVETLKTLMEQKVLIPYHTDAGTPGLQWRTLTGATTGQFPLPRIIPNSVRDAILDRVSRLTPAAGALLTAAAVLGRAASFRQIAAVSGIDELAGLDALEELVAKRLLLDSDQDSQAYMVAHDRIRDVVYNESSAARRQVLHSRAVKALAAGDPARLAYHALAAEMAPEALHYSIVAGDAALRLFAARDAIVHYETARQILAAAQPWQVELDTVQRLYTGLGRALELDTQFDQTAATYQELEEIAAQRGAPALRLTALTAQISLRFRLSPLFDPVAGESLAQDALRLAREVGDPVAEAELLGKLMDYYRIFNRMPEAIRCGDQALAMARDLNLREQTANILISMARYHAFIGHLDQAEQELREACALWRELNSLPMLTDCLASLASLARWTGDYDLALSLSEEGYAISESIAYEWGQAYNHLTIGYIYWDRGEPSRAIRMMEECVHLAETANFLAPQVITRADVGALYASLGDTQRGIALMQQALQFANERLPTFRAYVLGLLARQYLLDHRLSEAEALIAQGRNELDPQPSSYLDQWFRLAEAELAHMQNNFTRTLELTGEILQVIRQSRMRSLLPAVLYLRGQCFVAMGHQEDARSALLEAQSEAERIESRRMLMQILATLADIEADPGQAGHLIRKAEEFKEYIADHSPPELRATFLS